MKLKAQSHLVLRLKVTGNMPRPHCRPSWRVQGQFYVTFLYPLYLLWGGVPLYVLGVTCGRWAAGVEQFIGMAGCSVAAACTLYLFSESKQCLQQIEPPQSGIEQ
jgi:hypothetical protein